MLVMPLFHANATMCQLLMITLGGSLYLYHSGSFDPEEMLEVVAKPHRHFPTIVMMQANWKKATNILT
jgi:acyl-CoA synthetase (AMP-forming)/AMP-acid ligase II